MQRTQRGDLGVEEQRVVVTPATYVRPGDHITVEGAVGLRRFLGIEQGLEKDPAANR